MTELTLRMTGKDPIYITFLDLLWDWVDIIDTAASKQAEADIDVVYLLSRSEN
jgi:hypothetical protein